MIICPECAKPLADLNPPFCPVCGFTGEIVKGIPVVLCKSDRTDPVFSDYLENYEAIARTDIEKSIQDERYIDNQAENLVRFMGDVSGKSVLDVGSGKGFISRKLAGKGAFVTALDIAVPYLETYCGKDGISALVANAENIPFAEEFDFVVATDVLEHVINPASFLFCLNRALKRGGKAFIRVPYRENLINYTPLLGCPYRFVHLRSFDETVLSDMVSGMGFTVTGFKKDGFLPDSPRPFWHATSRRWKAYENFLRPLVESILKDPTAASRLPGWLAAPLFRPLEICVAARKQKAFRRRADGVLEAY